MTRMSRTIGLVLLGGAALSACCCLIPRPQPAPPVQQYDENGNPIPLAQTTSTHTTVRRHGPLWVPWYWGGSSYSSGYRSGPLFRSGSSYRPSGASPVSPGGSVTRGGFGSTGRGIGGTAS